MSNVAPLMGFLGTVVGSSTKTILRDDQCGNSAGRTCESLVGNVVTDAMRTTYASIGVEFAITNSGGLRDRLTCPPAGGGSGLCPVYTPPPFLITRGQVLAVLPHTGELTLGAVILGVLFGVPAGMAAALCRNRLGDYVTRLLSLLGVSFPSFVSAVLLLLAFAIHLRWFPVVTENDLGTAAARLRNLVLPAVCLGSIMAAYVTRVTRSAMLDVLGEDYVRTAHAKGLGGGAVVWHALRNALIPVTTVVGLYLGILIGNSVLVEVVFARPGLGKLIVGALGQRDYTLLQGLMVVYAFIIVLVNLVTDLTYGLADPRVTVVK